MAHPCPTHAPHSTDLEPSHTVQRANAARIHSEIAKRKLELAALEKDLAGLEKLAAVEESLGRITYPVLTLPNEITSNIFVACLPSHGRVRPSPCTAPLVLAQVCGLWREVALSTSELWRSVDLFSGHPGSSHLLEAWLSRAKRSPLSLTFRGGISIGRKHLSLIRSFAGQIARIELNIAPAQSGLLQSLPTLPGLRSLAITNPIDIAQELVKKAPALSELRLLRPCRLPAFLPQSLTTLDVVSPLSGQQLWTLLKRLHILAELKCTVNDWDSDIDGPLVVLLLRSLHLAGRNPEMPMAVVADLTLPNLRTLKPMGWMYPELLKAFIKRSSCTLSELYLDVTGLMMPDGWASLSGNLLSVARLELEIMGYEDTLSILSRIGSCRAMWPLLTSLVIRTQQIEYGVMLEVLSALRSPGPPTDFRTFELRIYNAVAVAGEPQGRIATDLRKLMAEGLKFSIGYDDDSWPPEQGPPDRCAKFP